MNRFDTIDDPRRRLLVEALAAGVFSVGLPGCNGLAAQVFGGVPTKLPPGTPYRVSGDVTVNQKVLTLDVKIRPGDSLRTGKDSELVFCVGESAMIVRSETEMVLEPLKDGGADGLLGAVRIVAGRVLSVFSPREPVRIQTVTAVAQIRGTGVYVEADPQQTYFCTCYGVAEVSAVDDPDSRETVASTHHDRPLYIVSGSANRGKGIRNAPFINHTDQELALIETLVGRTLPFTFTNPYGTTPQRRRY